MTFLHFFSMGTTTNRSEREFGRHGWTTFSFRRHIGLFSTFKDSFKGFKDDFIRIQVPACFLAFFLDDNGTSPFSLCIGIGKGLVESHPSIIHRRIR